VLVIERYQGSYLIFLRHLRLEIIQGIVNSLETKCEIVEDLLSEVFDFGRAPLQVMDDPHLL
jgi:hypothetical protein